jgi:hypothetical protein
MVWINHWDIEEFAFKKAQFQVDKCGTSFWCTDTVTAYGSCWDPAYINYGLFGLAYRLCLDAGMNPDPDALDPTYVPTLVQGMDEMDHLVGLWSPKYFWWGVWDKEDWADAGFSESFPPPGGGTSSCTACTTANTRKVTAYVGDPSDNSANIFVYFP